MIKKDRNPVKDIFFFNVPSFFLLLYAMPVRKTARTIIFNKKTPIKNQIVVFIIIFALIYLFLILSP